MRNQSLAPVPATTMPRLYIWIDNAGHRADRVSRYLRKSADRKPVIVGGGTISVALPTYPSRSVRFSYFVVN
jgi:hypothetical protein